MMTGAMIRGFCREPHTFPSYSLRAILGRRAWCLWTQIEDAATGDRNLILRLQVATDAGFAQLVIDKPDFIASASHDHCIKIKVTDLDPDIIQ